MRAEVLTSSSSSFTTTQTDRAPSFQLDVNVTFDASGWSVTALPQGGSFGPADPTVTGLQIASGATDLATIEFFTSHNAVIDTQNKGFWLDNLVVETGVTVEPSGTVKGDCDLDGDVDFDDIPAFIAVLQSGDFLAEADCDCTTEVNFADIPASLRSCKISKHCRKELDTALLGSHSRTWPRRTF